MADQSKGFRTIVFVCPACAGDLHDTGRKLQQAPLFDCLGCKRAFRWWRFEWRPVAGFVPLNETPRPAQ